MKKTTAEFEIKMTGGRIVNIKAELLPDGACKLFVETDMDEDINDIFVLIEASKLSLNDEIIQHEPQTNNEKEFKELLIEAIQSGLKDFYKPKYDPSFDDQRKGISYRQGKQPALGWSYEKWDKEAKNFCPERNSRLGTAYEYCAFMAVLIKMMVECGFPMSYAWNEVCNNSKRIGHYWDSENPKGKFENTGSREICGWYDLANAFKLLAADDEHKGFGQAGGLYCYTGTMRPLSKVTFGGRTSKDNYEAVGWIVLEK